MKIEKLGFYRDRKGDTIEVFTLNIGEPNVSKGSYGEDIMFHQIGGRNINWPKNRHRTYNVNGRYFDKSDHPNDIVEYLSIEEYPELYI